MKKAPRTIRVGASPVVIGGDASLDISVRLARRLKAPHISCKVRVFSDGESKIMKSRPIPKGSTAIVVQSTHNPVDTNLLRALLLVSAASRVSRRVIAVVPYMGYARQDREFLAGEIVSIREIAKLFAGAGAHAMVVVDMHSQMGLGHFTIPIVNVESAPAIARHFAKMKMKDKIVVSPDAGAKVRAAEFARQLGCDLVVLSKKRDRKTGSVKITTRQAPAVKGRDVILIDDMISTGSSIIKAATFLKSHGCGRVHVACTHGLYIDNARSKMKRAGIASIVSTNTIPGPASIVDVSELVSKVLVK